MLDEQDKRVLEINQHVKETEEEFDELEKCCGLFTLPWKKWAHKSCESCSDFEVLFIAFVWTEKYN